MKSPSFYRRLLCMAAPIIAQSMISVGIQIMDTIMLSGFSEAQISASSLAGSYIQLVNCLCLGIGFGGSVIASQLWAEKNTRGFCSVISIVAVLSLALGLLSSAVTLLFPQQIISFYADDPLIIEAGTRYLRWIGFALFFLMLSQPTAILLRSANQPVISFLASLLGFFVNVIANWLFIYGNLGCLRMEIAGAAVGTLISYVFQTLFVWGYLLFFERSIRYTFSKGALSMPYIRKFFSYSIPVIISDLILGISLNITASMIGHIGSAFTAAYAIISTMLRIVVAFTQGLGNAGSILIGYTLGEQDLDTAQAQGVTCAYLSLALGAAASLVIQLIGIPYINYYGLQPETKEVAYVLLRAAGVDTIFMAGANMLTKGVLRGGGDTKYLMVMDNIFQWLVSIPMGYLAAFVLHLPPFWIYLFLQSNRLLKVVFGLMRLHSRKWMHIILPEKTG